MLSQDRREAEGTAVVAPDADLVVAVGDEAHQDRQAETPAVPANQGKQMNPPAFFPLSSEKPRFPRKLFTPVIGENPPVFIEDGGKLKD